MISKKKFNNKNKKLRNSKAKMLILPSTHPQNELSWSYSRWLKVANPIYNNSTTNQYSFTSGSDVRYLTYGSALSGNVAFSALTSAFRYYTIKGIQIEYLPNQITENQLVTVIFPILYITVDDEAAAGNPSNALIAGSTSGVLEVPMSKLTRSIYKYQHNNDLNSIWNTAMNTKYSTSVTPANGVAYLGSSPYASYPGVNFQQQGIYELYFYVTFEGSKY